MGSLRCSVTSRVEKSVILCFWANFCAILTIFDRFLYFFFIKISLKTDLICLIGVLIQLYLDIGSIWAVLINICGYKYRYVWKTMILRPIWDPNPLLLKMGWLVALKSFATNFFGRFLNYYIKLQLFRGGRWSHVQISILAYPPTFIASITFTLDFVRDSKTGSQKLLISIFGFYF